MAETRVKKKIPAQLEIDPTSMPLHTPREMSLLAAMSGKQFQELGGENADPGDREAMLAWFTLRRLGFEPTWDEACDVLIDYKLPNPPNGDEPRNSPPSAVSGA